MARSGGSRSASGGAADPAAARRGCDGAAPRLRHRAPSDDHVPFGFSAAGEGRGLPAGARRASPPPAGRTDDAHGPADLGPVDHEWLDSAGGLRFVDPVRLRFSAVLERRRHKAGTETEAVQEHDRWYRHDTDLRSAGRAARGRQASGTRRTGARASEGEAGEGPRARASEGEAGEAGEARETGEARRSRRSRRSRRRRATFTTGRTAHHRGTCITRLRDWPTKPTRRGRATSPGTARPDEAIARDTCRTPTRTPTPTAKGTPHTTGATASTEARGASRLTAGARPSTALDAHADGGRDLPDRARLLRDRSGRDPQRHAQHRLRDSRRRPERAGAVLAAPRPAPAARGHRGRVAAAAGGDQPPRRGEPRAVRPSQPAPDRGPRPPLRPAARERRPGPRSARQRRPGDRRGRRAAARRPGAAPAAVGGCRERSAARVRRSRDAASVRSRSDAAAGAADRHPRLSPGGDRVTPEERCLPPRRSRRGCWRSWR